MAIKASGGQSKKQQALLNTAMRLFLDHGIRRVTIEEICRKADVSKMTFYRLYSNKTDITKGVIDMLVDRMQARIATVMEQDMPFGEKMKSIMHIKEETMNTFSGSFLDDLLDDNTEAGQYFLERRSEGINRFREMFLMEQKHGSIRDDVNINFVMIMADYFRIFLKDERLRALYPSTNDLGRAINEFFMYGVVGQPGEEE